VNVAHKRVPKDDTHAEDAVEEGAPVQLRLPAIHQGLEPPAQL
jgi:hypothetical protein